MYAAIEPYNVSLQSNKPTFLKVSCFLGYFFVSLTILMGVFMVVVSVAPGVFRMFPELNFYISIAGGKLSVGFALMNIILSVIAFFGVIQIWHQLKIGFWIFTVSKIALLSLPFLFIDLNINELIVIVRPIFIVSVILILLFGLNYKKLI